jgi:hypothetical protein
MLNSPLAVAFLLTHRSAWLFILARKSTPPNKNLRMQLHLGGGGGGRVSGCGGCGCAGGPGSRCERGGGGGGGGGALSATAAGPELRRACLRASMYAWAWRLLSSGAAEEGTRRGSTAGRGLGGAGRTLGGAGGVGCKLAACCCWRGSRVAGTVAWLGLGGGGGCWRRSYAASSSESPSKRKRFSADGLMVASKAGALALATAGGLLGPTEARKPAGAAIPPPRPPRPPSVPRGRAPPLPRPAVAEALLPPRAARFATGSGPVLAARG